jgi:hypothetical protein
MEEVRKIILVPRINEKRINIQAVQLVNDIKVCQEFHVLPRTGGLYDQDSLFVYILQNYLIWSSQREEIERNKAAQLANRPGRA